MKSLLFVTLFSCILFQISCQQPQKDENLESADSIQQELQSFAYLNGFVGKTPDAVSLWQTEPLRSQLSKLVGDSLLPETLQKLKTAKVVKRDHVLYTIAPHPDSTNQGYTVALFDTLKPDAAIIFIQEGAVQEVTSNGEEFYWPDEVRNLIFNYQRWTVYEGVLPCEDCSGIKTTLALSSATLDSATLDSAANDYHFFLQQTFIQSNGDTIVSDMVKQYKGTYEITGAQDMILHLKNSDLQPAINFLKKNALELELLDKDLQKINTDQNLLLSKVN